MSSCIYHALLYVHQWLLYCWWCCGYEGLALHHWFLMIWLISSMLDWGHKACTSNMCTAHSSDCHCNRHDWFVVWLRKFFSSFWTKNYFSEILTWGWLIKNLFWKRAKSIDYVRSAICMDESITLLLKHKVGMVWFNCVHAITYMTIRKAPSPAGERLTVPANTVSLFACFYVCVFPDFL